MGTTSPGRSAPLLVHAREVTLTRRRTRHILVALHPSLYARTKRRVGALQETAEQEICKVPAALSQELQELLDGEPGACLMIVSEGRASSACTRRQRRPQSVRPRRGSPRRGRGCRAQYFFKPSERLEHQGDRYGTAPTAAYGQGSDGWLDRTRLRPRRPDRVPRCLPRVGRRRPRSIARRSGRGLDVGCGPGQFTILVAERLPDAEVWGIDLAPTMIELARRHARSRPRPDRLHFEVADVASAAVSRRPLRRRAEQRLDQALARPG